MAEVTNELLFEVLKGIQNDVGLLKNGQRDIKDELIALRQHQHAAQGEINAVLSRLASIEGRMERMERRMNIISEPAE